MKLNISYTSHGMLIRRYVTISILLFLPMIASGQFSYRFEIIIEKTFSFQTDKISQSKDQIRYYENTNRTGDGIIVGIKYNMIDIPIGIFLGYENNLFTKYSIKSNIRASDNSQELLIKSADFNIQYLFFNKSTFKPNIFVGLSFNSIDYSRQGISYNYTEPSNDDIYMDVTWKYNLVQSEFDAFGLNFGAGLTMKVSDKIGINGNIKFRYIPQNLTSWLDNQILVNTFSIGVNYRLLKRKYHF